MTWVNLDHCDTSCLCFVEHKPLQLLKRPAMEAAFGFDVLVALATPYLGGSTYLFQVLKHKGTALWGRLYNPFREDMVMVFSLPKPFARKLFQVPFSRFRSFCLQFATDAKHLALLLLPTSLTKKETCRCDSRTCESQVNTNDNISRGNVRLRDGDNHMQRETSLAITQISTTRLVAHVLQKMVRNREVKFHTPVSCGKATSVDVPLDPIRTDIIADRGSLALGRLNGFETRNGAFLFVCFRHLLGVVLLLFGFPSECRLDSFGCLDPCSTDQLRGKIGVLHTKGIVCLFVQLCSIATLCGETNACNLIKTRRMFLKCSFEDTSLLMRRIQVYK